MTAWFDEPGQARAPERRPWDDVLEAFAARTGRPCWPVIRVTPSTQNRERLTGEDVATVRAMWAEGVPAEEISRLMRAEGVVCSLSTVHSVARGDSYKRAGRPKAQPKPAKVKARLDMAPPQDTYTRAELAAARGWGR
jgi:hypothetical protein